MSYVKLPKTVGDHAIGYQSVVQAINNAAEMVLEFDAKHSIGVGGNSPYGAPLRAVGRHDDILIARSVADFTVDTTILIPSLSIRVGGPVFGDRLTYTRLGTGQWRIFIATPQLFGAVALMKSTASVDEKATCYTTSSPALGNSVLVSTWIIDTGVWVTADLPFSLAIWTQAP